MRLNTFRGLKVRAGGGRAVSCGRQLHARPQL